MIQTLFLLFFVFYADGGTIVRQCGNVKISETEIDAPVKDIIDTGDGNEYALYWLKPHTVENSIIRQTVFLLTLNGVVWRSFDAGASWDAVNSTGGIRAIYLSSDKTTLYALGNDNHIWHSTNNGANFTIHTVPGYFQDLKFHPKHPDWILATAMGCLGLVTDRCSNDLYVSQNFGETWKMIRNYIWIADWHDDPNNPLYITVFERKYKAGVQNQPPYESSLTVTSDLFASSRITEDNLVAYKQVKNKVFLAKESISNLGGYELYVSEDSGQTFNLSGFLLI